MVTLDANRIHSFLLHSIFYIIAQKKKKKKTNCQLSFKKKKFEPQKASLFYCLYCYCHLPGIHAIYLLYKGRLIVDTRKDETLNHFLSLSGTFVPKSVLYLSRNNSGEGNKI